MSKAYGFIEITGVVAAINALDIMCKTADVELAAGILCLITIHRNTSGRQESNIHR